MSLDPKAQALYDQYAAKGNSQPQGSAHADFDVGNQGRRRVNEALANRGITDRESPEAYTLATKMALQLQAHQARPHTGGGIGGNTYTDFHGNQRSKSTSFTGRSLADIAKGPREDSNE